MKKYLMGLFMALMLLSSASACATNFLEQFQKELLLVIDSAQEIPPSLKEGQFNVLRSAFKENLNEIFQHGIIEIRSTDADIRPIFVGLQAIFEQLIADQLGKQVKSVVGVIHTPAPATSLCTKGEISEGLATPSVVRDTLRRVTVEMRSNIVRNYLARGGDLFVVYPESGKSVRSAEQLAIYADACSLYASRLNNCPLDCKSISDENTGAFYEFTDHEGKKYGFAIKMSQANNASTNQFAIYFGQMKPGTPIYTRISAVKKFLAPQKSLDKPLPTTW